MKIRTILSRKTDSENYLLHAGYKLDILEVAPLERMVKIAIKPDFAFSLEKKKKPFTLPKALSLTFPYMQFGIYADKSRSALGQVNYFLTGSLQPFDGDFNKLYNIPVPNSRENCWLCLGDDYKQPNFILKVVNDFFARDFLYGEVDSDFGFNQDYLQNWAASKTMPLFAPIVDSISVGYFSNWFHQFNQPSLPREVIDFFANRNNVNQNL